MTSLTSKLPPGLPLVLWWFLSQLSPAATVVVVARVLHSHNVLHIPSLFIGLIAFLSIPLWYAVRIVYKKWSIKRRAARMGAVLPPSWEGESFGNMDLFKECMERWTKGYPGERTGLALSLPGQRAHVTVHRGQLLEQWANQGVQWLVFGDVILGHDVHHYGCKYSEGRLAR